MPFEVAEGLSQGQSCSFAGVICPFPRVGGPTAILSRINIHLEPQRLVVRTYQGAICIDSTLKHIVALPRLRGHLCFDCSRSICRRDTTNFSFGNPTYFDLASAGHIPPQLRSLSALKILNLSGTKLDDEGLKFAFFLFCSFRIHLLNK